MEKNFQLMFNLTTVFLEDDKTGNITAFFAQFPDASAEGRNKEEAEKLLMEIFPIMLEEKKEQFLKEFPSSPMTFEDKKVYA